MTFLIQFPILPRFVCCCELPQPPLIGCENEINAAWMEINNKLISSPAYLKIEDEIIILKLNAEGVKKSLKKSHRGERKLCVCVEKNRNGIFSSLFFQFSFSCEFNFSSSDPNTFHLFSQRRRSDSWMEEISDECKRNTYKLKFNFKTLRKRNGGQI